MAKGSKRPVQKFKIGYIEAAIWENDGGFYTVVLSRTYKDGDEYRSTDQLAHGDLHNAMMVLKRAEEYLSVR